MLLIRACRRISCVRIASVTRSFGGSDLKSRSAANRAAPDLLGDDGLIAFPTQLRNESS
jgi:hypothetical protein